MNNDFLEGELRRATTPLPPHLKARVLDACASKAALQQRHNRRANWRLAWGFAAVCALHFGVGGALQAQQNALFGVSGAPNNSPRYATNPADLQASLVLRSQLLAELSDPRRRYF